MKMKIAYDTELYVSQAGYLVIKQSDGVSRSELPNVLLSYEQVIALRDYLPLVIDDIKAEWNNGIYTEEQANEDVGDA